ncbi:MAG: YitT family protein [Eubacteriales bacterium]
MPKERTDIKIPNNPKTVKLKNFLRTFELKPRYCLAALLGSAILAFGLYNIHSLSGVTEGGVLGLTLLLKNWLDISPSVSGLILNSVCYILGWRSLGRSFVAYSIISSGGFSLVYKICELFPPLFPRIADMPLVASLVGALFVGVGSGICVRVGGAPSGDDALAMSLSRLARVKIQWIYLASDLIVLLLSLSYIPVKRIVYSLLTVIISGQIIGLIQTIGIKKENKI